MTWFIDASVPVGVRRALELVRTDVVDPSQPSCPVNESDKDSVWLPIVGRERWAVIMRDKHIRTRPRERQAFLDADLALFVLTGAGNYSKWDVLSLLVRRWGRMEEVLSTEATPFIKAVTQKGVDPLRFPA